MQRFLNPHSFDNTAPFKKVMIGYTLVSEVEYLQFIEQVGMHVDAGWKPAGDVQVLGHHHWEELMPHVENRFCLQMVLYEAVEKTDGTMQ